MTLRMVCDEVLPHFLLGEERRRWSGGDEGRCQAAGIEGGRGEMVMWEGRNEEGKNGEVVEKRRARGQRKGL